MPAVITKGKTIGATQVLENTDLHTLVDSATIASIDQTNMDAGVGIIETSTSNPSDTDALWKDTSGSPSVVKFHNGTSWIRISPATTIATLDVVTTDTDVTLTTTADFTLRTFTLPADTLSTNNLIRIDMSGTYVQNSGGARTITFKLKYGSTTVLTMTSANTIPDSASTVLWTFSGFIQGAASTGAQYGKGEVWVNRFDAALGNADDGTAAEDSTGDLALLLTVSSDTGNASITYKTKSSTIELLEAV